MARNNRKVFSHSSKGQTSKIHFIEPINVSRSFHVHAHTQSCPTLWNPLDCSPPGSSVHGIFQARILEWIAISSSRGSSRPRDRNRVPALQTDTLPSETPGKPTSRTLGAFFMQLTFYSNHSKPLETSEIRPYIV